MSSENKILIVLETNKLRDTSEGDPTYHTFTFGSEYGQLKTFIQDKKLSASVDIAVTEMSVSELIKQKVDAYYTDIGKLKSAMHRMSGLPSVNFSAIQLPAEGFDCHAHLSPQVEQFLLDSNIKVIKLAEGKLSGAFKDIIRRSIEKRAPFKRSDTGFKDVVIWETLLNYEEMVNYQKVYFVSSDAGFTAECKKEFEERLKIRVSITTSIEFLIEELAKDFEPLIEKNKYAEFASKDYFKAHIDGLLSSLTSVPMEGDDYQIEGAEILSYLEDVEYPADQETEVDVILVSTARGKIPSGDGQETINIKIKTSLDVTGGILDSECEGFYDR
jgi:predicted XRE-type DNA-binding protein